MEYNKNENEHHVPSEYIQAATEYHKPAPETFKNAAKTQTEKKADPSLKKFRKMGYLLAASAATVMIAHAALPTGSSVSRGYHTDISHLTNWGSENGGVMPIQAEGQWGLMAANGDIICEPKYNYLICNPNKDGYSVFCNSDNTYYVLNEKGNEIFTWVDETPGPHHDEVCVTDDNIISINDDYAYVGCWTVDGEKIYEAYSEPESSIYASVFYQGVAIVCMNYTDSFNQKLYVLSADGSLSEIPRSGTDICWRGEPCADGYILCHDPASSNTRMLVDIKTGNTTPALAFSSIAEDYSKLPEGSSQFSQYCMNNSVAPDYANCTIGSRSHNRYDTNYDISLEHYKTYACVKTDTGGSSQKEESILFDYEDADKDTNRLHNIIATYDDIQLDDSPYLCVKNSNEYFYMDYSGNIVSKTYAFATTFNENGHAMVIKNDGNAYLINTDFETLDTIKSVDGVESCGDAFLYERDETLMLYTPFQD